MGDDLSTASLPQYSVPGPQNGTFLRPDRIPAIILASSPPLLSTHSRFGGVIFKSAADVGGHRLIRHYLCVADSLASLRLTST
ncbi:hypothetical protein Q1695_009842 [Nippostrongylus brasiliensis]|nr:hypothetical protein Q1695_009842 [Nippostrongylus brasiliensis]